MRKATLASVVFVVCGYAASAQLTVTPRLGIESFKTCLQEVGRQTAVSPQIGVRLDYHGVFAGVATNRSQEEHADAKTAVRLEAGYMLNLKAAKNLRIQPFAGMAVADRPSVIGGANVVTKKFLLGIQYLQGFSKNSDVVVVANEGTRSVRSNIGAFSVSVGMPLTVKKKEQPKKSCTHYYRSRCGNYQ